MEHAIASFEIGDRVRYVGLTVTGVGRGDVGQVFRQSERYGKPMYWVKFPGHVDLACWPAELELVRRRPNFGERMAAIRQLRAAGWAQ